MAPSNQDDFDGYRKWLGISNKKRSPGASVMCGFFGPLVGRRSW